MLIRTPLAPSIDVSMRSGLEMALLAASAARFSPAATPVPMKATPMPFMIDLHVGEVEVDEAGLRDQVGDALDGLAEDVVGELEGVLDRRVQADGLEEPVVGDGDDRVHGRFQVVQPLLGLPAADAALELEGQGADGEAEDVELGGQVGDDRRRARPRPAAQAGGQEDHVRAFEDLEEVLGVLHGRLLARLGPAARAEALGQLGPDLDLDRSPVGVERLLVGVDGDEIDALDPGLDHPVEGVAAASADADDPDLGHQRVLDQVEFQLVGHVFAHGPLLLFFLEQILDLAPQPFFPVLLQALRPEQARARG